MGLLRIGGHRIKDAEIILGNGAYLLFRNS